ncbi:hypothetical protein CAC42_6415 [Sphaceloma murrayae]|uniref:Methyltransferase domain-containing protein n=1 Tax=Sphaceloma murrayae TaxID=2082308 RepID=A0A2K1QMD7_9PEZI|nr:hypothetical protein CAC42_6415 [Sphaceloma murrayae]
MARIRLDNATVSHFQRTFQQCSLQRQANLLPVDEEEESRLNFVHQQLMVAFDNEPILPRLRRPDFRPKRVLDCGFGTGAWGREVGDSLNEDEVDDGDSEDRCEIVGLDVFTDHFDDDNIDINDEEDVTYTTGGQEDESDTRIRNDPPDLVTDGNLGDHEAFLDTFDSKIQWDLNQPLLRCRELYEERGLSSFFSLQTFDLINIRCLTEGVHENRWTNLLNELRFLTRPGGWIQIVEIDFAGIKSSSGLLFSEKPDNAHDLQSWIECYRQSLVAMHRQWEIGEVLPRMLRRLGYTSVDSGLSRQIRLGAWHPDDDFEVSNQMRQAIENSLYPLALWYACGVRAMPVQQYRELVQKAITDLRNEAIQPLVPW